MVNWLNGYELRVGVIGGFEEFGGIFRIIWARKVDKMRWFDIIG